MMGGEWTDVAGWAMGLGMVTWVLVFALVVGFVVWLMNRGHERRDEGGTEPAEEILRRRFAGGEIDAEEYERSLEALRR